jgi:hypothetical protein
LIHGKVSIESSLSKDLTQAVVKVKKHDCRSLKTLIQSGKGNRISCKVEFDPWKGKESLLGHSF